MEFSDYYALQHMLGLYPDPCFDDEAGIFIQYLYVNFVIAISDGHLCGQIFTN